MATSKTTVLPATPVKSASKLSTTNYVGLMAVVGTLIVIIGGFICYTLGTHAIHNTKVLAKKYQAERDISTKLDNAPKLISSYNQLGSNKTFIMDALPTTADFPQLITVMSTVTSTSGVRLKSISSVGETASAASSASAGTSSPKPQTFDFQITAEGPYSQIVQLLRNIEQSARPMHVTAMTFAGGANDLSASLSIETYYQDYSSIEDGTEVVK